MKDPQQPRGPLTHRVLIGFFTILLAILAYWSLDFFMDDIEALEGPQYEDVEARVLDKSLLEQEKSINREANRIEQQRKEVTEQQAALRASTSSSQETMNQLLEIQRLTLQRGTTPTEAETKALSDSKRLFLANQAKYQQLNEELEGLRTQSRGVQERYDAIAGQLNTQRKEAHRQHEALLQRHEWKKAALKLAVLIPLFLLAYYFFRTKRSSIFAPIVYASGAALVLKLFQVLHQYFPSRYFKYILMAIAIAVVVQALLYLLRMVISPKKEFLLKQYREAYERFVCPVCEYPIRRGPLRYAFWTKRTIQKLVVPEPSGQASDDPYACPSCGVKLYEKCSACLGTRHSLLPHCEKCGASREVPSPA